MFCFASTANTTRAPETRAAGCANAATAFLKPRPVALGAASESEEKALASAMVCVQSARAPATGAAFHAITCLDKAGKLCVDFRPRNEDSF